MILKTDSLSFSYNPGTPLQHSALQDVSFQVRSGEIIGLIGPGGSGKSCLLRCIAGVLKPSAGKIATNFEPQNQFEQRIGLVIQEPEQQFFLDTVEAEISFALVNQGLSNAQIATRIKEALNVVGFSVDLKQSPFRLSGGQQRRLAIASILVLKPQLLLLDEPTVGLDANGLAMITDLVQHYRQSNGSIIIISHDLDFLYQVVDRFLLIAQGELVADFLKQDFNLQIDRLKKSGVAIPERVQLAGMNLPDDLRKSLLDCCEQR